MSSIENTSAEASEPTRAVFRAEPRVHDVDGDASVSTGPLASTGALAATGAISDTDGLAPTGLSTSGLAGTDASSEEFSLSTSSVLRMGARGKNRGRARVLQPEKASRLVAGVVELPFMPIVDPEKATMSAEEISQTLQRSHPSMPRPELSTGDFVASQYEVRGCLAHGGMGWIYLAIDHNVADRWVVLKGLLHASRRADQEVALAEREILAELSHPAIVKIFNFIGSSAGQSSGGASGSGSYIVMEYIGGSSLRDIRRARPERILPVDTAIGYILEILPALEYLHSVGLIYNDLKPENIMVTGDEVKLIDMGAVSGIDEYGHIYGTKGFQAPEILKTGPTVSSDLFTVGRTLASLITRLPVQDKCYAPGIPTPEQEPLFEQYESLHRFLLRATNEDPGQRFASAIEMHTQLEGVLREYIALSSGVPRPGFSGAFSPQRDTFGTLYAVDPVDVFLDGQLRDTTLTGRELAAALPVPLSDSLDPSQRILAATSYASPEERIDTLKEILEQVGDISTTNIGVASALLRAYIDSGQEDLASIWLAELRARGVENWRLNWYSGVLDLVRDDPVGAHGNFQIVATAMPGEVGPKLALAASAELAGTKTSFREQVFWSGVAIKYYTTVWSTDRSVVSSAFGLARQLHRSGQYLEAVAALDALPANSRHAATAKLTTIMYLCNGCALEDLREDDLRNAARRAQSLSPVAFRTPQTKLVVLSVALQWLRHHMGEGRQLSSSRASRFFSPAVVVNERDKESNSVGTVLASDAPLFPGVPFTPKALRFAMEEQLRALARKSPTRSHRYTLVDLANKVRPRTLF